MNQKRTGELLKSLRKEKGLTQEQLAERFRVSSRTVSRWEAGSNLPDVAILIELADYYEVDIREILDGERKSTTADQAKDTLKKVAEYASKGERKRTSGVVCWSLGISIALLVCNLLFSDGRTGLLYGIVPAQICEHIRMLVYGLACCTLLFYLRVHGFLEKPSDEPEKTVVATVISKEVRPGTHRSGRSKMGYSYVVNFRMEDGEMLELYAYEVEFGALKEGMRGTLTYQGRYFVAFEANS